MDNEDLNHITYNRFSNPKKYKIHHKYTDSDSNLLNSMKQSKNSPGFAMALSPTSYSSNEKREDSLTYRSSSFDEYQKQKHHKNHESRHQNSKHQENNQYYSQQQKTYPRRDINEIKASEYLNSNRRTISRERAESNSRSDLSGSLAKLSLNDRKQDLNVFNNISSKIHKHRLNKKSSGDIHNYLQSKKSHKTMEAENNNSEEEFYSDGDSRRDLIAKDGSSSSKKTTRNEKQYQSPSVGPTAVNIPVCQNPNYNKFNDKGLDISVGEILVHGLKAMLLSKVPLCYFLHTLIEDYCCENLFFYLEIEQYKVFMFENAKAQLKAAQYIYITYLDASSKIEVNIDEKLRRDILKQLNSKKCNLSTVFDKASEAVFALMESSFAKFSKSEIKNQMIDELDNTNIYNDEHKVNAIRILTNYLDKRKRELETDEEIMKMNSVNNNMGLSPEQVLHLSNVQRNKLIYALTHEFIRAFLELDFDDESVPGEVCVFRPPIQYIQNINEDPFKHLSSFPQNQYILQDIQITINTDNQGQQYQVITTPPIPIASFRLDGYESTNNRPSGKNNPIKKLIKTVNGLNLIRK